jgi:hypothetical protein
MEVVLETNEYPRLRLRCSGARAGGERHTFYIPGLTKRIGRIADKGPMQVECPVCGEAVSGGCVEVMPGWLMRGGELVEEG